MSLNFNRKFFNRYYLCNSLVWTCEYSGRCGLTYAQAIASEQETKSLLDALPPHFQRAILALVHNSARTNMKMLEDEIIAFYRERFIVGEQLDLSRATTNGCRYGCVACVCLCLSMYLYVCIRMYVFMYVFMYGYMYVCVNHFIHIGCGLHV